MKYFKTQMNQSFLKHKQNISTAKEKLMWDLFLDLWTLWWVYPTVSSRYK